MIITKQEKNFLKSLLWVWEFSKKVVLLFVGFHVLTTLYAMVVMIIYQDFSFLGELIAQSGNIMQNVVGLYLIKSGFENVPKIIFSYIKGRKEETNEEDDAVG